MSASKAPYNYTPNPRKPVAFVEGGKCGHECTKPVAWYANGNKVFALVTYVAGLVWLTLVMAGILSPWASVSVLFVWLLALTFAYGGDGR